jgi:3-dehydroquinate dehydratase II
LTIPVVEVHLSNPGNREEFRHKSLVSPAASGVIAGFGPLGYRLAIQAVAALAEQKRV